MLLLAFFALAVAFGPFPDPDSPAALLTGFAGIAAMALQNAVQRVHLASLPPTTLMTGNTTQATIDAVDLLSGQDAAQAAAIRTRFGRMSLSIAYFRRRLRGLGAAVLAGRLLVPGGAGAGRRRRGGDAGRKLTAVRGALHVH